MSVIFTLLIFIQSVEQTRILLGEEDGILDGSVHQSLNGEVSDLYMFSGTVWCNREKRSRRKAGSPILILSPLGDHQQGIDGHQGLPHSPFDPSTCAHLSCRRGGMTQIRCHGRSRRQKHEVTPFWSFT